jgi:XisH protein
MTAEKPRPDKPEAGHLADAGTAAGAGAGADARDRLHDAVRNALVRDGWTITHDPLRITSGRRNLYVDLGAERLVAAEKGALRIAVEVKAFSGPSDVEALEQAMGQHVL